MNFILFIIITFLSFSSPEKPVINTYRLTGHAQGTTYTITYYTADSVFSLHQADSIFKRLDSSLSVYKPYSLISQFNSVQDSIVTDEHLQQVIKRSLEIYAATRGAFDITVWPLVNGWGFGTIKPTAPPDSAHIAGIMPCIGSNKLRITGNTLYKLLPCLQVDVNGIAQGYSVDVIALFMESKGINNYLVELGGEIRMKGRKQPGNIKMKIGIEAPLDELEGLSLMNKIIVLDSGAITTSGNYRRFYESGGRRITHLIDPLTGFSVHNELVSVTVLAKDAMTADAFDNALMVMGLGKGLHFAEENTAIEAYFIYRNSRGIIADTATSGFYAFMQN